MGIIYLDNLKNKMIKYVHICSYINIFFRKYHFFSIY